MVNEGYKQTEIGVIPKTWKVTHIGDIADFQGGSQPDISYFSNNPTKDNVRLIQIRDYKTDKYATYIPISLARRFCTKHDIMIGRYGPPIFQILRGIEGAYNVALIKTIPKQINREFLYYVLKDEKLFDYIELLSRRSSGQTGVDLEGLRNYRIPLPPSFEQELIVQALSDVDDMISSLEKLIEKKKAIKQGAMQDLLTGKKRLPGFTGEWKRILLEDVCIFYSGGTPSKKRNDWWNGSIPWISSSDLSENSITSISINRYITQDALDHSATRLCPKNAVSIVSRVGVGKVAVTPCELCTSQDFTTIVSSAHNSYFLAYMLIQIMKDIAMQAQGTSIKGVTVEDIEKIKISTPPIEEQDRIVSVLSDMDSEIEELEQKLNKTRQLKQGMMQQLLTGTIRLV